jgi:nucleotide-binding universal stress UspA family protein
LICINEKRQGCAILGEMFLNRRTRVMAYKSLLTVATSAEAAATSISAAAELVLKTDAHLDVLALGVDRTQVGYSYIGSGAVILAATMEQAEVEAHAVEKAVNTALHAQVAGLRSSVETAVAQLGSVSAIIASRARYADLVVLRRPYGEGRTIDDEVILEAALFAGTAPVLVVPDTGLRRPAPKRIVLAWNQSREAMVATRRAMPFLKQADVVDITVIDPPQHGPERSDPGGLLCQMLVRHGIRAEVTVLARTMPRISDVLIRHARDRDADMLVMGAYGHSRFREAILGGATRDLLEQTELPVLMAH